jgi:ubiquinone/menaquinone biosynthesis C-methylase UbiE
MSILDAHRGATVRRARKNSKRNRSERPSHQRRRPEPPPGAARRADSSLPASQPALHKNAASNVSPGITADLRMTNGSSGVTRDAAGTAVMAPSRSAARVKESARTQFDDWAVWYDKTVLNELVFYPSIRACQEEIARWQIARGDRPFRMLDVGCGTGSLIGLMSREDQAERLIGLDFSREMVRRAGVKFAALPNAERVHIVNGDSERLPFIDSCFDVLTCCNSFHHYPHQQQAIGEFRRVLRPGGLMVLVDGFRDNLIGYIVFEIGVKLAERHIRHAKAAEMRSMMRAAGFGSVTQRKMNVFAPLLVNIAGVI